MALLDNLTLTLPFTIFVKAAPGHLEPIFSRTNAPLFLMRQTLAVFGLKGVNMKAIIISISIILASTSSSQAQFGSPFLKVDTVTTGDCDDTHPVLDHNSFWSSRSRGLVFERQTSTQSMIATKMISGGSAIADSSVTIISSTPIEELQTLPDFSSCLYYVGTGTFLSRTLVAWQRKTNNTWNIYFSVNSNDSTGWSEPQPLTTDTISSTNVRVVLYRDTTFILAWKKMNVILYTLVSVSSTSQIDTLAVSNSDSLEFDISSEYSDGGVVWTSRDTGSNSFIIKRQIKTYPSFALTEPETLSLRGRLSHPQFIPSYSGYFGPVLYESSLGKNHEILAWDGLQATNMSKDTSADSRNVKVFISPMITASNRLTSQPTAFWNYVLVMEKYFADDSLLVFEQSSYGYDTVSSAGHNRDACIGSWLTMLPNYAGEGVLVVWESNRTGRSHIYSRYVVAPISKVEEENEEAQNFELMQNYPNPFNPTTTIRFHVSTPGFVSLKIFDILGREVETLVDEELTAGGFSTTWDGKNFPSGVYFYRLQAGHFAETKKLIFLK